MAQFASNSFQVVYLFSNKKITKNIFNGQYTVRRGLHRWLSGKEPACQCRRQGFNPWVRKIPWRRAWQPIPVFLPGESCGQRSLVRYSLWGRTESDTTERLNTTNEEKSCAVWLPMLHQSPQDSESKRPGGAPTGKDARTHGWGCEAAGLLGKVTDRLRWSPTHACDCAVSPGHTCHRNVCQCKQKTWARMSTAALFIVKTETSDRVDK